MTALALRLNAVPRSWFWALWLALAVITIVLWNYPETAKNLVKYPRGWILPLAAWISVIVKWCVDNLSVVTRAIAAIIDVPFQVMISLLAKGFTDINQEVIFPRLSWIGIVGAMAVAGYALGGWRTALLSFICFLYVAIFARWDSAMLTLASVALCVPIGIVCGLLFGILAFRLKWLDDWVIRPSLDIAQTMPAFAYLVPILLLFGFGPVPAMIATVIFATPPMVRATKLALEQVPEEITSMADMLGCTRRQRLWRVMIPTARPLLMVGINQVIMMTLNFVIIASMIGAGGSGFDVLTALRRLDIGQAMEAGLAIVVIAIALDRMSLAAATEARRWQPALGASWFRRHPYAVMAVIWLLLTTLLGLSIDAFANVPESITFSTQSLFDDIIAWMNVNFFDLIEAVKVWLLVNILNPLVMLPPPPPPALWSLPPPACLVFS